MEALLICAEMRGSDADVVRGGVAKMGVVRAVAVGGLDVLERSRDSFLVSSKSTALVLGVVVLRGCVGRAGESFWSLLEVLYMESRLRWAPVGLKAELAELARESEEATAEGGVAAVAGAESVDSVERALSL